MKSITIIGSGASGTILAINLLKNYKSQEKLEINLIEKDPDKLNLGVAYSTQEFSHLLNVKAGNMSIFKDEPNHLEDWLEKYGYPYKKDDFIPRQVWGLYLKYFYKKSITDKSEYISVNTILEEAINIETLEDKYTISLTGDMTIVSDIVVLALGHISPSEITNLPKNHISKYFRTPWQPDLYTEIDFSKDILLIGSGLTSIDIILSLQERKYENKIWSISRNGHLPVTHQNHEPYPDFYQELENKDINEIFSVVRKHLKLAKDTRSVIDSLRKYSPIIWKNLNEDSKSRFLRHLQSFWNPIRHRVPQESRNKLLQLETQNLLEFITGKIIDIKEVDSKIIVTCKDKSQNETILEVGSIVNCIGPESNYKRINLELIKNLILNKTISPELLSIKTNNFRVIDGFSKPNRGIVAIGPILKGELYETTAIPEIRAQAERLSKILLDDLKMLRPIYN